MKRKPSFFRQAGVLTKRYFHIYFNNTQNLILAIAIPLLTIIIVCLIACPNMYTVEPNEENEINDGYPVLNWEYVVQYEENEDSGEIEEIEYEESKVDKWDGVMSTVAPSVTTTVDGEDYFMITSAADLSFLSQAATTAGCEDFLTYNYILQTDINLKGYEWTPIGTKDHPFTGTFEGNGHTISNLSIDTDKNNVGLFGWVESDETKDETVELNGNELTFYHNGIVRNLQVKNPKIKNNSDNTGAIVGTVAKTARVYGVSVKGEDSSYIRSKGDNVGGIVGQAKGSDVYIHSCYVTCDIKSSGKNVGGIVGDLDAAYLSAAYYAIGDIEFDGDREDAENFGSITGNCNSSETQLLNCFYEYNEAADAEDFKAVDDEDKDDDYTKAVSSEELERLASFLVPFKNIETAYDIENPDEDEEEEEKSEEDEENTYNFKQDGQTMVFTDTRTGLFMIVCIAIFTGVCNSIQEICKERNILKREYMTNLNLSAYVVSKLIVQACICAVQMLVVVLIFSIGVSGKLVPDKGVMTSIWIEYYITLFLLTFAADTFALVISSIVKNSSTANTFIPIVLIVEFIFSGVLFDTDGFMGIMANLMISKWGIAALASSSGLNNSQNIFLIDNPQTQLQFGSAMSTVEDIYAATTSNLLTNWGILLAFSVVSAILCRVILIGVKNDRR